MTTKGEAIAVGIAQVHGFCSELVGSCTAKRPEMAVGKFSWLSASTYQYLHAPN